MPRPTQPAAFPATAWSQVFCARDAVSPDAREAREAICRAYWGPVYGYFRALGSDREDALDLTQELLADFCEHGLGRVAPAAGSLRSYLKAAARHQLTNLRRDRRTVKRGGRAFVLPLDGLEEEETPRDEAGAEACYDRQWARTVFQRAMDAIAAAYEGRGKGPLFAVLKETFLPHGGLQPYALIGAAFNVSEAQIKLEVHRARKRLATALLREVAATLGPDAPAAEAEAELRHLLRALAHGT